MNMKILLTILVLLVAAPAVLAGWVEDNGEPSWLVYGQVSLVDGSPADNATYTIRTYNHDSGGELLSVQTGAVGESVAGHIYNSRNLIDTARDTVIVEIVYGNESLTIVHTVTENENNLHVVNLGTIRLETGEIAEPEEKKTMGIDVTKVRLSRGEYLSVGELLGASVRVSNNYDIDLEDVRIAVGVPDLGVRKRAGPFDLDDDDDELRNLYIEIPEWAEPGDYYIRIEISNDDVQRVVHRVFTVVEN